jgi:hypothetical protein
MAGSTSETAGDSDIFQTFTAAVGDTTLSFWYNVTCADSVQFDWATATLTDNTSGTTTTPLAPTCVPNSGWQQVTTAIMAGHSYTLTLTNHDDGCCSDPVYTLFDDVAATGSSVGNPVRNSASAKCLNDSNGSVSPGNPVVIWTCISNGANEKWSHPANPGELIFSGQCLTDPSPGGSGTKQVIEPCTGATNQIWNHNSKNEYIVKFNSGCLTDPGGSKLNGTQVTVSTCKNVSSQHWTGP